MARTARTRDIEQAIAGRADLDVLVEEDGNTITLEGMVDSLEDRQAAEDIAADLAGDLTIENNLEVEDILPTSSGAYASSSPQAELAWVDQRREVEDEVDADLTDQELLEDAEGAGGAHGAIGDQLAAAEGDAAWVPPSDPVLGAGRRGEAGIIGGFSQDSLDDVSVERSAEDRRPGDEALTEAIMRELREDAATTDLNIRVIVREGVAHLHGHVAGAEDADAAEEVAARVPGVVEVREELDIDA
jgi:osmotically-inducible protein OsmY